ncbi:MAG: ABC transporter ATP-binding protein [Clostridia bacterium]|nr:ABC transporter ATP-binding protein [Clostridia bacterium]
MIDLSNEAVEIVAPVINESLRTGDFYDDDEDVCVDVRNVSVMFNLSKNREDGLKEYFINMIKGRVSYDEFWALRNISLKVHKGDALALIGQNGSGKSTLLKTIAGIIKPTRGSVEVTGSIAPLIEMSGGFDRSLSARENIFLVGAMHGHTRKYMKKRFDEIIEFAELEKFVDVPIKNYSSGMVSRLGFAVATCVNADIIIADEVLAVGDAKFRMKCEARIQEMLKGGTTILYVSHSAAQVKKLCRTAVWLEKGCIVDTGNADEICDKYMQSIKNSEE